ncbi:hypothetical protein O1L68_41140 [Streptomyces lydicus]|nr:hypothetical protein [Streptomyces lydicus]
MSRYVRRLLADSVTAGRPVPIEIQVRWFRYAGPCGQTTLAKQVDGLADQHGRRSFGSRRCWSSWRRC